MKKISDVLRLTHEIRHDNDYTCEEIAELLESIAEHYQSYGKQNHNEQTEKKMDDGLFTELLTAANELKDKHGITNQQLMGELEKVKNHFWWYEYYGRER